MTMRILLFNNFFPPVISGTSYYTSSLAQALCARGHEPIVVTLDWGPKYIPADGLPFPVYRLPVIRLPKLPLFYNLEQMGFAYNPGNVGRLKALITKHGSQIYHHVNHIFDSNFLSIHAARACGIPIVGSITTLIQNQNPWKQKIMSLADRLTVGWFGVRRWDAVVSPDWTAHEYVGELYGKKVQRRSYAILLGARLELLKTYEDDSLPKSKTPQIVFVGHIHPFRNPEQLIRAMPLILRVYPDARLILAGRVDLKGPVKIAEELGLVPDHVQFLGQTCHEETVRLMKTSHVFANWVTGPYHSLGTAAIESMLCATPVVNDLPENVFGPGGLRNGENIVLVDSSKPESVAEGILRLLRDEVFRRKIGLGGRRFVLERLNWESIAAQMERFYQRILAGKKERQADEDPFCV
jgi:glycosyltransferase involved in cell wall biosynthesis